MRASEGCSTRWRVTSAGGAGIGAGQYFSGAVVVGAGAGAEGAINERARTRFHLALAMAEGRVHAVCRRYQHLDSGSGGQLSPAHAPRSADSARSCKLQAVYVATEALSARDASLSDAFTCAGSTSMCARRPRRRRAPAVLRGTPRAAAQIPDARASADRRWEHRLGAHSPRGRASALCRMHSPLAALYMCLHAVRPRAPPPTTPAGPPLPRFAPRHAAAPQRRRHCDDERAPGRAARRARRRVAPPERVPRARRAQRARAGAAHGREARRVLQ